MINKTKEDRMITPNHQPKRDRTRGQSLVEFALLFPILIMLLLGIMDLGRAYYALVALNDAAEEGAMYAAIDPDNLTEIQNRAVHATSGLVTLEPAKVSRVPSSGFTAGEPVTVTVAHDFTIYTPLMQSFFNNGEVELRGRAVNPIISP
jgi:Flp pilus assembly protein TadG